MGKKSPSPPPAPDPGATAAAQGAANRETALAQAELNMINQTDAYGNKLTYNPIGKSEAGNPRYEAITTLSPEQQQLLAKEMGITNQAYDTAGTLFNNVQTQLGSGAPQFDETYRQQQLANMLSRTEGERNRRRQALETQLANQGITLGSQAYTDAMNQYQQGENDFLLAADIGAGNEARSQYGTALGGRTQAINELTGLLGLGQVQSPQFANTPQTGVAPTDVIGPTNLAYQGQLAGWQAGQNRNNAMMGGISGLAGNALGGWAALGFPSDARIKHGLEYRGVRSGLPVYDFSYIGSDERHTGFLAQDVEKIYPDAVVEHDGIKRVRYDMIPEA